MNTTQTPRCDDQSGGGKTGGMDQEAELPGTESTPTRLPDDQTGGGKTGGMDQLAEAAAG